MRKKLLIGIFIFSLSACASIVSDSTYPVTINSTPSNLSYILKDSNRLTIKSGTTPSTVILDAGDGLFTAAEYSIEVTNAKGNKTITNISSTLDNWYFGNLLFSGVLGMLIIDPITGAMYELPESVNIDTSYLDSSDTQDNASALPY